MADHEHLNFGLISNGAMAHGVGWEGVVFS
jgi:hypothetical protein